MLTFQNICKNDLHVFTRDLSEKVNINIKYAIQDVDKQNETLQVNKSKKSKKPKKKDIIIQNQIKLKLDKNIKKDNNKLNNFLENINDAESNIFNFLNNLETEQIKHIFKFKMLEYFWNKKNIKQTLSLYFELYDKHKNEPEKILLNKIHDKINKYDYNLYMLKNLGDILPPLNFWNQKFKFDDWQKKAINIIKSKECLLVKAPTSSGKSFISTSAVIFHEKILYVCPSDAVAYQIGSQFIKMKYRVHFLLDDIGHFKYDNKCNVFIGTPEYIENYLYKIDVNFNYAVFDEIHDIEYSYENLIKLIRCNFVALSATINNINDFVDMFKMIHPDKKINTIEYNNRFINIQKWLWSNDKLQKIHPISCCGNINDLKNYDLKMTPNDIAVLWETIYSVFDEIEYDEEFDNNSSLEDYIDSLSPDNYFKNNKTLLTLDNSHDYEKFIVEKLIYLNKYYPTQISKIINTLTIQNENHTNNITKFLDTCKHNKMFPMLIFNTDEQASTNIFYDIYNKLINLESTNYPYHYDILEKKQSLYLSYYQKRKTYSESIKPPKKGDSRDYIKTKLDAFDSQQKYRYINTMIDYYNTLICKIKESDTSNSIKNIQINNLNNDLQKFIQIPDFTYQDIYQKHEKYSYNISEPMSGNKIKEIRKKICDSIGINIPYTHPIFQMLKRGIGLYTQNLPEQYRRLLQTLLINRDIGVVVCGKMLSMGIDMPIKTTCLMGYKNTNFTSSDYFQMSGRSGRRGHDSSGNVIFYDIEYKSLINSKLPIVNGTNKPLYTHYNSLSNIKNINTSSVFTNFLNKNRNIINTNSINKLSRGQCIIAWNLRTYENYHILFEKINNEKYSKIVNMYDKSEYILSCIICLFEDKNILNDYKLNVFNEHFRNVLNIVIVLYNNTSDKREELILLYNNIKNILFKNNGFL